MWKKKTIYKNKNNWITDDEFNNMNYSRHLIDSFKCLKYITMSIYMISSIEKKHLHIEYVLSKQSRVWKRWYQCEPKTTEWFRKQRVTRAAGKSEYEMKLNCDSLLTTRFWGRFQKNPCFRGALGCTATNSLEMSKFQCFRYDTVSPGSYHKVLSRERIASLLTDARPHCHDVAYDDTDLPVDGMSLTKLRGRLLVVTRKTSAGETRGRTARKSRFQRGFPAQYDRPITDDVVRDCWRNNCKYIPLATTSPLSRTRCTN